MHEPDWIRAYRASRFAHLVHAVPGPAGSGLRRAVQAARARHVQSVFATTRTIPNPWVELPPSLVRAVVETTGP